MGDSPIDEKTLYEVWKKQNFSAALTTVSGDDVQILDAGIHNDDSAGADFKNARIRIGNLTYVGDIEIDGDYSDWKSHGHNIDNKYNSVVLHLSLLNKFSSPYVYTKDGRKVPTIRLDDHIDKKLLEPLLKKADNKDNNKGQQLKCTGVNEEIPQKDKERFVSSLGLERLDKKCKRIYDRLKELVYIRDMSIREPVVSYDTYPEFRDKEYKHNDFHNRELWEQLLYELIFEALGYSKNKAIMLNLAQNVRVSFLKKLGHDSEVVERVESAFFNIGGLYRSGEKDPENIYLKRLDDHWFNIKRIYDSKTFDETQWHFMRLRPQNFPTVRIAGGARLLKSILYDNYIETFIKKIREIRNFNVLINILRSMLIVKSEGYWRTHYVFNKEASADIKYFVGVSRADEMIINVLIPYFNVYFEIFGMEELSRKIVKLYNFYRQKSENRLVQDVAENLGMEDLIKKTIFQQGMIELFRSYCSKGRCLECEIGKTVFN